jgi:hypothetical protein
MKLTVEVCDVCHDKDRPVRVWRIAAPGGRIQSIAVCGEHARPLSMLATAHAHQAGKRGRRRVVTREQVESGEIPRRSADQAPGRPRVSLAK